MKYMNKIWIYACAFLLVAATACSDYPVFVDDMNPVDVPDDNDGDGNDDWDGTFEEGAVPALTSTKRAVVASFTTVFENDAVKGIERQGVLVSWRWLPTDADDITFDIYRNGTKQNTAPIANSTNYKDLSAAIGTAYTYEVRNAATNESLGTCTITPTAGAAGFYRSVKVLTRTDYDINDGAIGDLDGDGEYEIVIKRQVIGQSRDVGDTNGWTSLQKGTCILEAYKLDGSSNGIPMWTIDLGININQGQHTTQFLVYDFDGDGKAEVAVRTAEGTTFGDGTTIGDVNEDGQTDYRNAASGRVLDGPEFLSLVNGETGKEMARTDYISRGEKDQMESYWGDNWGNRSERYLMGVGHFGSQDGRASIVICRGYYENYQVWAVHYNSEEGKLRNRWKFNTANGYSSPNWLGQGNHNLSIGDVDNDGKDEVVYGACCIDHDGKGLYTTGLGHGDALHLGVFDPTRNGLQVVGCHESQTMHGGKVVDFRDAATGEIFWSIPGSGDIGRCLVADIDPETPGCEVWSSASNTDLYSCKGEKLAKNAPTQIGGATSFNMAIWWSGTLNREVLDGNAGSSDPTDSGEPCIVSYTEGRLLTGRNFDNIRTINNTKANPCFYGDIWGDWREEVIYPSADYSELRIFTTDFETQHRIRPLMEDHIYRLSVAHQNIGYNQPTHTGFYLGSDRTDYKDFK